MEEADPYMRYMLSFTTSIVVVDPTAPKVLCIRHSSLGLGCSQEAESSQGRHHMWLP